MIFPVGTVSPVVPVVQGSSFLFPGFNFASMLQHPFLRQAAQRHSQSQNRTLSHNQRHGQSQNRILSHNQRHSQSHNQTQTPVMQRTTPSYRGSMPVVEGPGVLYSVKESSANQAANQASNQEPKAPDNNNMSLSDLMAVFAERFVLGTTVGTISASTGNVLNTLYVTKIKLNTELLEQCARQGVVPTRSISTMDAIRHFEPKRALGTSTFRHYVQWGMGIHTRGLLSGVASIAGQNGTRIPSLFFWEWVAEEAGYDPKAPGNYLSKLCIGLATGATGDFPGQHWPFSKKTQRMLGLTPVTLWRVALKNPRLAFAEFSTGAIPNIMRDTYGFANTYTLSSIAFSNLSKENRENLAIQSLVISACAFIGMFGTFPLERMIAECLLNKDRGAFENMANAGRIMLNHFKSANGARAKFGVLGFMWFGGGLKGCYIAWNNVWSLITKHQYQAWKESQPSN